MENPFNLSKEKLSELMKKYISWLNSNPEEAKYPEEFRSQAETIRGEFLKEEVLSKMSDEILYQKIFKYSRSLEGPAHIRLGESRIKNSLPNMRRNLKYIISSSDSPFTVAQNVLVGDYKIEVFAKAFWSPILHARFPGTLPNWNNKTEKFLKKFGINISTSKLSTSDKYRILSESFKFLSDLVPGQDFFNINHLMHYGTIIQEGIDLIDKLKGNKVSDPVIDMIKLYKEQIRKTKLQDELYKWELLKKFRGRPDLNAADFLEEIRSIDYKNLMYEMAVVVKNHLAKDLPDEYRACFKNLFNDEKDLNSRVKEFMDDVLTLYRKLENNYGTHHDERTIATFLTYHDPGNYTFFKDSFYQKYCKLIGIEAMQKGDKYSHYMELITEFREYYLLLDSELLSLVEGCMNQDCFTDQNHLILAQDILFQMLDREEEIIEISSERIYKISMGEFGEDDIKQAISEKVVLVHKDTKAKGWSSTTQGEIFQNFIKKRDYFYLTHGNKGVQLLGMFVDNAKTAQNDKFGSEGWLERSFVEILPSINRSAYKGRKKWWTPNENSTCIEIPAAELEEANKLLFKPYFNAAFKREDSVLEQEETYEIPINHSHMDCPSNIILYGPPGTGKTYHTIDLAVKIVAPNEYSEGDHETNKVVYDHLVQTGQIVFTTFHQSMCYEDFIEGIKPVSDDSNNLTYTVEDGLFKQLAINSAFEFVSEKSSNASKSLSFNEAYDKLIDGVNEKIGNDEKYTLNLKSGSELEIVEITTGNNFLVQHKNGSRTYTVSRKRLEKLFSGIPDLDNITNINEEFRKIIGGSNASAYWAVLKKVILHMGIPRFIRTKYPYETKVAAVEKLLTSDISPTGEEKNFVLIIDEINRGNVSQVFGELITLIEEDKRFGKKESLSAILPYSRSRFFVPSNLFIIGTMNTADRSVEALDTALRRRFCFIEKVPLYNLGGMDQELAGVKIADLLEIINNRIEKLIDRDHQIGHSYFLNLANSEDLMRVFKDKLIPLLQEYFYGNYEKIGLVLGSGFVEKLPEEKVTFAKFPSDEHEYNDKVIYRIKNEPLKDVNEFTQALVLLMNK